EGRSLDGHEAGRQPGRDHVCRDVRGIEVVMGERRRRVLGGREPMRVSDGTGTGVGVAPGRCPSCWPAAIAAAKDKTNPGEEFQSLWGFVPGGCVWPD